MQPRFTARLLALAAACATAHASAEETPTLPEVTVFGERPLVPNQSTVLEPGVGERAVVRDSSALLASAPGAAIVRNGQQTGIVQLRGLSGDRVNVTVDGMHITPACPNHMDPPLHYLTAQGADSLDVVAGVTPVSQGGDSIGGTVVARSASPRFGTDAGFMSFGRIGAGYNGSNEGADGIAQVGAANNRFSVGYSGARQTGQDLHFAGGTVRDSGFDLTKQDVTLAAKAANGTFRLDLGRHETRDAGTPALPMDMTKDLAEKLALSYTGDGGALEARVYMHDIEHLMDNYSLRPNLNPMAMWAFAPAASTDQGASVKTTHTRGNHVLRVGAEYLLNDFDAYSQRLVSGVQQDIIRDASRDRLGVFGEWQAQHGGAWQTLAGVRSDTVKSDAANIVNVGPAPAAAVLADQASFNSRAHDITDHNWDATLLARYQASAASDYELGLARKTRAPNLVERYLWSPSNASAGQADGRTYLGNLDLDPEVSHQVNLGAAWHGNGWRVAPNLFYNRVRDYIQGTPIARLDSSGNPVLQYMNVGRADLYGVDGRWQYRLTEAAGLRGTLSYVRGKNEDNGDNLYRIAPLRADVALDYRTGNWKHTLDARLVAEQDKVSAYNGETASSGYGLLNLRTTWQATRGATLAAGIENLFDKYYADHLGGINRVASSDVPVGGHIPGAGRFAYIAGDYRW